jgi:hypothetical protein
MAKDPDHPKLRAGVKQTLEQAHLALDAYFEFLKKSVSSLPSGGTELGERLKDQGVENINALQEVVKRLSQAASGDARCEPLMHCFDKRRTGPQDRQC